MPDDDDSLGSPVCCPECGEIQDAYELYVHSRGVAEEAGYSPCMACGAHVANEDWIYD